ncbi:MAG: hypothetical protein Q7S81_03135 [bacterium]|nr:hypothetical protein [bacterium]
MKNIEEAIKQLKRIEPSQEYKAHSLRLILSSPQNIGNGFSVRFFEILKFGAALSLTGLLIVISVSDSFSKFNARLLSPVLLASLDEEKITKEAGQVDIKITIAEAKYYNDSTKKVAIALNETAKNGPGHLNSAILEKEIGGLDMNGGENGENIDELLNKLTM